MGFAIGVFLWMCEEWSIECWCCSLLFAEEATTRNTQMFLLWVLI